MMVERHESEHFVVKSLDLDAAIELAIEQGGL